MDCGGWRTFNCAIPDKPIEWTTSGLRGISRGPFRARNAAWNYSRLSSLDDGDDTQVGMSRITISRFSRSDNGGTIQCINAENNTVRGMASISVLVGEWLGEIEEIQYRCNRTLPPPGWEIRGNRCPRIWSPLRILQCAY